MSPIQWKVSYHFSIVSLRFREIPILIVTFTEISHWGKFRIISPAPSIVRVRLIVLNSHSIFLGSCCPFLWCFRIRAWHPIFVPFWNMVYRTLVKSAYRKLLFLFLNQNISLCCGYSKEPSQCDCSFEHLKHMLKLMGKKIFTSLLSKILFI